MREVAVIFHSSYGHTEILASYAAEGVDSIGSVKAKLIAVDEVENYWGFIEEKADAIIFGTPTYMGGVSAAFKSFMDASVSQWGKWKDKLAGGFTVSASQSGDKLATLQQLSIFAAQHQMVWVSLGLMPGNNSTTSSPSDLNRLGSFLGAMAQANADQGKEGVTESDRLTARHLGERIAESVCRWSNTR